MNTLYLRLIALCADENGATAIEYALIGSLLSIIIIGAVTAVNGSMVEVYNTIQSYIVPALEGTAPPDEG